MQIVHLQSQFPGHAKDVDWLPWVAENGFVLITHDSAILSRAAERRLVDQFKIHIYVTPKSLPRRQLWDQVVWFFRLWPEIKGSARKPGAKHIFRLPDSGLKIRPL